MTEKKDLRTTVTLIYSCNDNCISCPASRKGNRENPSFENIKKEINKILKFSNHIEFNGGEPTLRKDLIKILKYTEKYSNEIALLTNAQRFYYKQYIKNIAKIKNLKIITTLYGHNSKIHDAITRTPGSFKYKITGIKNLIKNKSIIELRILIHKMNYKYLNEIADFLIENFNKNDFNRVIVLNPKLTGVAKKNNRFVAEKLIEISKVLEEPVKKLIKKGYNVRLYHFPHCIIPESLWGYSEGLTAETTEVVFTENCKICLKKEKCPRIWKSYLNIFGPAEFKPIKNEN